MGEHQLRYIYQTIKPAKDANQYLTPKHFQDFLLNESPEMLNDPLMLLFREKIIQHIKFHKLPDGAWQGWITNGKEMSGIKEIVQDNADNKLNVEMDCLIEKSGLNFDKNESKIEIRISSRSIRGSGRDDVGNFTIVGAFKGPDW